MFLGNLEKDSESYPNPGRKPSHFQHFAILINTCCENLTEVRVLQLFEGLCNSTSLKNL